MKLLAYISLLDCVESVLMTCIKNWSHSLFARKLCQVSLWRATEPPSELALGPCIQHCLLSWSLGPCIQHHYIFVPFSILSDVYALRIGVSSFSPSSPSLSPFFILSVGYLYGQLSRLTNWKGGAHLLQLNAFCGANTSGSCIFPQYTHSKGQLCLLCSVSVTSLAKSALRYILGISSGLSSTLTKQWL